MSTAERGPETLRVAFDTSVLIDWHKKPESKAKERHSLQVIFQIKAAKASSGWFFIYLDAVRREIGGRLFDRLAKEAEIQDILPYFDQIINVSRFPIIFPLTFIGEEHQHIAGAFCSSSVSKNDSVVLADAVYFNADFFITTDRRLLRNNNALNLAVTQYGLKIVSPSQFLNSFQGIDLQSRDSGGAGDLSSTEP